MATSECLSTVVASSGAIYLEGPDLDTGKLLEGLEGYLVISEWSHFGTPPQLISHKP